MEKWLTIDEYTDTFLGLLTALGSLGSLAFIAMGFYLAKGYLKQHKEKVKEGEKLKLIYDTKLKLSEIRFLYDELYSIPFEIRKQLEIDPSNYYDLIDNYMEPQIFKIKNGEFTIKKLRVEILSNLSLLKLEELQKKAIEMFGGFQHLTLFHTLYLNKKTIASYPPVGIKEFQSLSGYMQSDDPFILEARQFYKEIQDGLTHKYWEY